MERKISQKLVRFLTWLFLWQVGFAQIQPGAFILEPNIEPTARVSHPIDTTVRLVRANGQTDTSTAQQNANMKGCQGSPSPATITFQDNGQDTSQWIASGSQTLVRDSTISISGSSLRLTGGTRNHPFPSGGTGFRTTFPSLQPVRLSCYIRNSDVTETGPYIAMVDTVINRSGPNVFFFGDTVVSSRNILIRIGDGTNYQYSGGFSNPQENTWYKIDLILDWINKEVDFWVDNSLIVSGFRFNTIDNIQSIGAIHIYNWESTAVTWIDELIVVGSERQPCNELSILPSSILLTNGTWNGEIVPQVEVTQMYVEISSISPTKQLIGVSSAFQVIQGCALGSYASPYSSPCVNCNAGEFSDTPGASSCEPCPTGTYNSDSGQTSCTQCPENTFNNNTRSTNINDCLPCPNNSTSSSGAAECASCSPGQELTMVEPLTCEPCPPGTYSLGITCLPCGPGTFNNAFEAASCSSCLSGSEPNFDATGCVPCDLGQFSQNGICLECSRGTYANATGMTECLQCPEGTFAPNPGSTSPSDCLPCPPGTASPSPGAFFCPSCSDGFSSAEGSLQCSECSEGTYSDASTDHICTECSVGTYSNQGSATCISCPPGFFNPSNASGSCNDQCGPGTFSRGGASECTLCPIGTFNNISRAFVCEDCSPGLSTNDPGSTFCVLECGNSRLDGGEGCDDGNIIGSDGCSIGCQIEAGWVCIQPGTACSRKTSGSSDDNTLAIGLSVGIIATVLICLLVVLGLIFYRRKKKNRGNVEVPLNNTDSSLTYSALPRHLQEEENKKLLERSNSLSNSLKEHVRNAIAYEELDLSKSTILGRGAFGIVLKGFWRGSPVAVKIINQENLNEKEFKAFSEEAELMRKMQHHPNVVLFLGIVVSPFCIVTEFLENGDLKTYLKKNKLSSKQKIKLIQGIANGMMHLAKSNIVHRDLAARNILLTKDLQAKVSDFGLSRITENSNEVVYSKSDVGPLKWMSPEALKRKKYSEKSDVWSFAICCIEILTSNDPYPNMDAVQVATAVVTDGLKPTIPENTPQKISQILMQCLSDDPVQRPNFEEISSALQK